MEQVSRYGKLKMNTIATGRKTGRTVACQFLVWRVYQPQRCISKAGSLTVEFVIGPVGLLAFSGTITHFLALGAKLHVTLSRHLKSHALAAILETADIELSNVSFRTISVRAFGSKHFGVHLLRVSRTLSISCDFPVFLVIDSCRKVPKVMLGRDRFGIFDNSPLSSIVHPVVFKLYFSFDIVLQMRHDYAVEPTILNDSMRVVME